MDSFSILDYVLHGRKVDSKEFCPDDWLEITKSLIGLCEEQLKYLSRFETLRDLVKNLLSPSAGRSIDEKIIELPPKITLETYCTYLAQLTWKRISNELPSQDDSAPHIYKSLLITRNGQLLTREEKYHKKEVKLSGPGLRRSEGFIEVVDSCKIEIIGWKDLAEIFWNPTIGRVMIQNLLYKFNFTIDEREMRLKNMKRLRDKIFAIIDRID